MRKLSRQELCTPGKVRPVILTRSQSMGTIQRVSHAPAAIIRDTKKLLEDKPATRSSPRKGQTTVLRPSNEDVLKPIYAKPGTVIAATRTPLDLSGGQALSLASKQRIKAPPSPQKASLIANSSRELLHFVRAQNPNSVSIHRSKSKRLNLLDGIEPRLPESEPNTSRRREASASPMAKSRQSVPRFPGSQSLVAPSSLPVCLPRAVVRFTHRTRTGSFNGTPKPQNQDSYLIMHDFAKCKHQFLFGVYDGHGQRYAGVNGHEVSAYIKRMLPIHLESAIPHAFKTPESTLSPQEETRFFENAFLTCYLDLNYELRHRTAIDCSFSGSTAVTVLVRGHSVMCANAGDSRAVIGQKTESGWIAVPLSRDHKPDDPSERPRIEQMGGRVEPFKGESHLDSSGTSLGPARVWTLRDQIPGLAMSRSIGDFVAGEIGVIAEPEIMKAEMNQEDKFLVLASDGVWEFITNQSVPPTQCIEMIAPFWEIGNIEGACDKVVKEAVSRWKRVNITQSDDSIDDITIVLAFLSL